MKKIKLGLLLLLVSFQVVMAQTIPSDLKSKTPEERAQFQTDLMKTKLKLDSNQTVKVKTINIKYAKQFEPILKSSDNKFSRIKKAMDLQKKKNEDLKKVFTAEQYKQYEKIESELKVKLEGKL